MRRNISAGRKRNSSILAAGWCARHPTVISPTRRAGFRAYSREAALRLNVTNEYTYTLETIIQAGQNKIAMTSVPIRTNPELRKSRLFKSMWGVHETQRNGDYPQLHDVQAPAFLLHHRRDLLPDRGADWAAVCGILSRRGRQRAGSEPAVGRGADDYRGPDGFYGACRRI